MIFIALYIMSSSRGQFLSFIFHGKSKGRHQFTDDNLTKLVLSFVSTLQGEKVKKEEGIIIIPPAVASLYNFYWVSKL